MVLLLVIVYAEVSVVLPRCILAWGIVVGGGRLSLLWFSCSPCVQVLNQLLGTILWLGYLLLREILIMLQLAPSASLCCFTLCVIFSHPLILMKKLSLVALTATCCRMFYSKSRDLAAKCYKSNLMANQEIFPSSSEEVEHNSVTKQLLIDSIQRKVTFIHKGRSLFIFLSLLWCLTLGELSPLIDQINLSPFLQG